MEGAYVAACQAGALPQLLPAVAGAFQPAARRAPQLPGWLLPPGETARHPAALQCCQSQPPPAAAMKLRLEGTAVSTTHGHRYPERPFMKVMMSYMFTRWYKC